ncbi:MAG: pyruvate kinase [Alphaproteobacteria bacterium CG_4_10_14_0_8_um_filter_37_21]|nr:MAG: pyruvate kinase [Alphaproteobacteria bacterium CG_4_10_14_0_8_um_filter_37_21]
MYRLRKSKIIATLGPKTSSKETIEELFLSGVDVFRLNFSHGAYEDHKQKMIYIRELEAIYQRPIAIMVDLQGPKLRIGMFDQGSIILKEGDAFCLDMHKSPGSKDRVYIANTEIFKVVKNGGHILLDDGKIILEVTECGTDYIITKVKQGGKLSSKKGVNLPDCKIAISALTEKDKKDLDFCLTLDIDWVALSFVQHAQDIIDIKELIKDRAKVIAKIEKPQALENIDDIIFHSDAIMLARGDLGVEVSLEEVPVIQKKVLQKCKQQGRPAIVATQMLESMIYQSSPTRAETSDVATAIYDGADAVMLSAETATGEYPVESVKIMDKIIKTVEHDMTADRQVSHILHSIEQNMEKDAMMFATKNVASTIKASAIVSFTICGGSTLRLARQRPLAPIIALPTEQKTCRMLTLVWGVHAVMHSKVFSFQQMQDTACDTAYQEGFSKNGDVIVISASAPFGTTESSNLLHVSSIQRAET